MEDTPQTTPEDGTIPRKFALAYPSSRLDPPITLVDRAREIELADSTLQSHVSGKLELIVRQIRALKAEAQDILARAERDRDLHRIRCNFEKKPGQAIHLYQRPDGERYFSLLSLADWRGAPPHEFLGSFKLNADGSFETLDEAPPS